jgi:hypothetical protein
MCGLNALENDQEFSSGIGNNSPEVPLGNIE